MITLGDGAPFYGPDELRDNPYAPVEPPLSPPLSPALCESVLMQRGGCLLIDDLLGATLLTALCGEANERQDEARHIVWAGSKQVWEWRGGDPARSYAGTTGGPIQSSIFASPDLAARLSDLCGLRLRLAGLGSFSYYEPGDFLALHRDIVTCDVTLLTCLRDTATGTPERSALRIYPAYARLPLTRIRSVDNPASVDIRLDRGQTAVLLGGVVPHEVIPMTAHQHRTVSIVCMTADV